MSTENTQPSIRDRIALSVSDACKVTSISRSALYRAISRGDLVRRKLGRRSLILFVDLERWLLNLPPDRSSAAPSNNGADHVR